MLGLKKFNILGIDISAVSIDFEPPSPPTIQPTPVLKAYLPVKMELLVAEQTGFAIILVNFTPFCNNLLIFGTSTVSPSFS